MVQRYVLLLVKRHEVKKMKTVVIGSGAWGTALAQVLCDKKENVIIWGKNEEEVLDINQQHQNSKYFPDVVLNKDLKATLDLDVVKDADVILLAVPSIAIETVCKEIDQLLVQPAIFVNVAKGFHPKNDERMSDVIRHSVSKQNLRSVVSLIGPSHAEEVVIRMLTTICSVSLDEEASKAIQKLFSNDYMRIYCASDEIGCEMGAALKNSIAVASGILSGLGYGDNTRAALLTRGLAEIVRYGVYFGGKKETFYGLTGLGDLIVTCTSPHSRNFQAGYQIGKENSATRFLKENTTTVEGIRTTKIVYEEAQKHHIKMPIINEIYKVLYEGKDPAKSAVDLMNRELIEE